MPGELAAAGLGLSAVNEIYKTISGAVQSRRGRKEWDELQERRRSGEFNYSTPEEAYKALNFSKGIYQSALMPGQAQAQNTLGANTSQAIELAKATGRSPAEIMSVITSANQNQNTGTTNLATSAAGFQLQNADKYQQQLQNMADYKDKEWAYNTYMPYMQDAQYAQNLIGAGAKNISGGLGGLGAVVSTAGYGGEDNPLYNLFKKRTNTPPSKNTGDFNLNPDAPYTV